MSPVLRSFLHLELSPSNFLFQPENLLLKLPFFELHFLHLLVVLSHGLLVETDLLVFLALVVLDDAHLVLLQNLVIPPQFLVFSLFLQIKYLKFIFFLLKLRVLGLKLLILSQKVVFLRGN